eukprot:CAMPEP_0177650750 /NCGR_PEP_ID=MMETSP0447-20121125/12124_1 /TAXON_ID=0 /ORGANISM="Stygamoeba regulata, Strain BSH-02190019" /LENGTH=390 /DNA_ID=CAMNT_0019153671 /DNA_START=105 /DNA_END=1277 /DNA_ORIENTATION=+
MADSQSFKLYFADQIRRLRVPTEKCNWEEFRRLLETTYGGVDGLYHAEMSVIYVDADGDRITVNSQPEWEAMMQHLGHLATVCLELTDGRNAGHYYKDGPPAEIRGLYTERCHVPAATPTADAAPEASGAAPSSESTGRPQCPLEAALMEQVMPHMPMVRDLLQGMFSHGRILPEALPALLQESCKLQPVGRHAYDLHVNLNGMLDGVHQRAIALMGPDQPREKCEEARTYLRMITAVAPKNAVAHYNLACAEALCGAPEPAVVALRKSIELGYNNFAHMRSDEDLASLRDVLAFQALLDEFDPSQEEHEVKESAVPVPAAEEEKEPKQEQEQEVASELSAVEAQAILEYTTAYQQLVAMGFASPVVAELLVANKGSIENTLEALMESFE